MFSQTSPYDLSQYKLPDIKRQSLDLQLGFGGNSINSYNDPDYNYELYYDSNSPYKDKTSSKINNQLFTTYNRYVNLRRYQQELISNLSVIQNNEKTKLNNKNVSKTFTINPDINFDMTNRFYLKKKLFVEINPYVSIYNKTNTVEQNAIDGNFLENNSIQVQNTFNSELDLAIGYGRIEPIQDARHAIYIFDELAKVARLQKTPSNEDIEALATLISKLKNKRYFDYRLNRMEELQAVDSFLLSNGFIENNDAVYFTTLSDYWGAGNSPNRSSGNRITFSASPNYSIYKKRSNSTTNPIEHTQTIGARSKISVTFVHEKPLNLYWQNSFTVNSYLTSGKSNSKNNDLKSELNQNSFHFNYRYSLNYYPNTRTNIGFSNSLLYNQNSYEYINAGQKATNQGISTYFRVSANYYLSPQTRISIYASIYQNWNSYDINYYDNSDLEDENQFKRSINGSYRLTITHSIF